ncbi:MAG TPA: hypothetical protein VKA60_21825 [Blastocatellia bacterium]|nr:hypothetical protein [Blastocatellia bacterium]
MNLNVVTQALNGEVMVTDPLREREFKRARKQISEGIHGAAIGTALLVAALLPYILNKTVGLPLNSYLVALALIFALAGIIKLFRSSGSIIDAKVGQKLLDSNLQPRATGNLNSLGASAGAVPQRASQRLNAEVGRSNLTPPASTRPVSLEGAAAELKLAERSSPTPPPLPTGALDESLLRAGTGRINRDRSTPLRRLEKDDDLMSKLRN